MKGGGWGCWDGRQGATGKIKEKGENRLWGAVEPRGTEVRVAQRHQERRV